LIAQRWWPVPRAALWRSPAVAIDQVGQPAAPAAMLAAIFNIDGHSVALDASIGIVVFPDHGYGNERDNDSVERLTLVSDLRRASEEDELIFAFSASTGIAVRSHYWR
jgi:predicted signal transduction protein with EAL and GGDEF domain